MCYVCSCFAWGLDLLQRVITFGLACILSIAVCFGMTIAIIAGIAYGYNYSMAEFITFTRSDVTVFMRRGQFSEKPDITYKFRRTGDEEDLFANATTDYEDQKPAGESKPLSDTWLKNQDTRKYAEILTKYSPPRRVDTPSSARPLDEGPVHKLITQKWSPVTQETEYTTTVDDLKVLPESAVVSIVPNPLIPTVSWKSGSTEIMMRNYKPMEEFSMSNKATELPGSLFPAADPPKSISILSPKEKAKGSSEDKLRDDFHKSYVPMRVWGTTPRTVISDDLGDDVDEDTIVYKPV